MSALPLSAIGHNSGAAPLTEMLPEETIDLKSRADELVAAAGRAAVTDDETAGKAVTMAKMLKEHAKKIDDTRKTRKEPFLEDGRTVDRHFQALAEPVTKAVISVVALIDGYRRQKDAEAAAERRRIQDEADKAAREAAAILEKAKEQPITVESEVAYQTAQDRAAALTQQANATTAAPIASEYGFKAGARKIWKAEITDLTAAIKHARKIDPAAVEAAIQQIYDRQVRAGVRALPGAAVTEDSATVIR